MGLFDLFKKEKPKTTGNLTVAPVMTGHQATFTDFGNNIYASDIIVQAIRCKANEMKKLKPRHIRLTNGRKEDVTASSIARVLLNPNEVMTTADFLEKITILRELTKNAYVYPTYYMTKGGEKVYTGLYPLKPRYVEYQMNESGVLFIHFKFYNGTELTLPRSEVIHWRKDYGANDYFGGAMCGSNDDAGLLDMLKRYDLMLQSLSKALECSCQINGVVQISTYSATDDMEKDRAKFEESLRNNESGVLFTDLATTYTHIPRDIKLIDSETLKEVYQIILRASGTSLPILNGDYTPQQKAAFYEHTLEADIISLGQEMTKVLFSERELSFGNEVVLYPSAINFMSMENKISALQTGLPAGIFTRNEARELLGYPPIEGGDDLPRGYDYTDNLSEGSAPATDEESVTNE